MSIITHEIIGKAVLETLERRQMLAGVSFSPSDGILAVQGQAASSNDLAIHLSQDGSTIWGVANGQAGTPVQTSLVRQIRIIGGESSDTINVDSGVTIPVYVQGGNGDDAIHTGDGNDTIKGGNGNDTLDGAKGNDVIDGGNGSDSIHGGAGKDQIRGGGGDDWIDGDNGNDSIDGGLGRDTVTGGGGSDVINNTNGRAYAVGSYGNDTIVGMGNDTLVGGPGQDVVIGGITAQPPAATPPASMPQPVEAPVDPNATSGLPIVQSFSLIDASIDANTGAVISGFAGIHGEADLNLTTIAATQLGIRANVPSTFNGSIAFSVDGQPEIIKTRQQNFTLGPSDWDASVGAHSITARVVSQAAGPSSVTPLSLTLNVIRDVVQPSAGGGGDSADAPTPLILAQETTISVGHAIHVNGVDSTLKAGTPLTAKYEWDFGDPDSKYNDLRGFNAAHAYDTPGTYAITLTVTDETGAQAVTKQEITVTPSDRKVIYVSSSTGSDSNSGLSPQQAIQTLDKASTLVADKTEILLNRGDQFSLDNTFSIKAKDVVIGAYGSASDLPRVNWTGGTGFTPMFRTDPASSDVTFEDLSFDKAPLHAGISVGGKNITVRGCEFLHIGTALNGNVKPTGVLAQDNSVPLADGMDGYFAWIEGTDHVYLGNTVANSTREHGIRDAWADRVLIAFNNLTNLDRRADGDPNDRNIQTLTLHLGNYMYVYDNTFNDGRVEVGPLGGTDGLTKPDWKVQRINWVVLEDNTFNGGSFLDIDHGTNHMVVRDNVFNQIGLGGSVITVGGYSSVFQRDVEDLTITRNTAIDTGNSGDFLWLGGPAQGITLTDNVFIAPDTIPGYGVSGGVYVADTDLSSFNKIDGNVWPTAKPSAYAQGGVNFVGTQLNSQGFYDELRWNDLAQVGNDTFENAALGSQSYSLTISGQTAGAAQPRLLAA